LLIAHCSFANSSLITHHSSLITPTWEQLADVHQALADARRHGDPLAVASAEHRVQGITDAIGWRFAAGLFAASRSEDVRAYVAGLLDRFGPIDREARDLCADLAGCVEWLGEELIGLRQAVADLRVEVGRLTHALEVQHEQQRERATTGADPAAASAAGEQRFPRLAGGSAR